MSRYWAVKLESVSKSYRKGGERIVVLDKLDLQIEAGEFVCLMGPSGSGKTTTLNLLAGLDRADSGRILIGDAELSALSEAALTRWRAGHIGFVFQSHNLLPGLTACQNVEVPLLLTALSRAQRQTRVAAALELVGLKNRAKHYPAELSGGQEQRVAIARAIVSDAPLLICDEPTGDLDRGTADEILDLLVSLQRQLRKTIVMVTHDATAASYANRVVLLDKGRLNARAPGHDDRPVDQLGDGVGA